MSAITYMSCYTCCFGQAFSSATNPRQDSDGTHRFRWVLPAIFRVRLSNAPQM